MEAWLSGERDRIMRAVREHRGEAATAATWAAGAALPIDVAITEALAIAAAAGADAPPHPSATGAAGAPADPAGLTAREVEVLRLVAQGESAKEVAHTLGIGVRTVEYHLKNVYAKLGARGRADAVAQAASRGLLDRLGTP
jgi:DNA-binding CsgD family transcriptional regulator